MGGHCQLSNQQVFTVIKGLPEDHSQVRVQANLHFIDDWQGESASIKIDGSPVWMRSVTSSKNSMNICGGDANEAAFNVPVLADTKHEGAEVKISFQTNI